MDYEQKYNAALERAKEKYSACSAPALLEYIFPELKKSEDERIRKEIIDFLGLPHPQFVGKRDHEKWIAWLEKQGEQNFDYEHADIPQKDFAPIEQKTLNAEKQDHMLDSNKVIMWLNDQACQGWIEDVQVDKFIAKFKKDFGL